MWIAILAGVLLLGGGGYVVYHDNTIRAEEKLAQEAIWKPKVDLAEIERDNARAQRDQALAANKTLEDSIGPISADRTSCVASVNRYAAAAARAMDDSQRALAAARERLARYASQSFDMLTMITKPDPGGTCEERMLRIGTTMDRYGREWLRDAAGTGQASGAAAGKGNQPAANQGNDPGAVRIRP
jgi:hypothetical protein